MLISNICFKHRNTAVILKRKADPEKRAIIKQRHALCTIQLTYLYQLYTISWKDKKEKLHLLWMMRYDADSGDLCI